MNYIYLYILTFLVFLLIDFIWLSFVAKNFYFKKIGHLLSEKPNLIPAFIFYLIFVVGILVFVILPGYESQSISKVLVLGSLFGVVTYATYDLTNLSTLRRWPLSVTVIDVLWGAFLSCVTGLSGYFIAEFLNI